MGDILCSDIKKNQVLWFVKIICKYIALVEGFFVCLFHMISVQNSLKYIQVQSVLFQ